MAVAPSRLAVFRNRPLMLLMVGHFIIDMYGGMLPLLYPLLTARFDLDLKTVGLVSLAYTASPRCRSRPSATSPTPGAPASPA